jgi:hypothetical protein
MQIIDGQHVDRIMVDSIRRRLRALLTSKGPHGWRAHTSQLTLGSKDSGTIGCVVQSPKTASDSPLPALGETIGVAFRVGRKKCMFSAVLRNVNHGPDGTLFTLTWPTELGQLQRRVYERVSPPRGSVISVRFWHEGLQAPSPETRDVRHGQLEDLSAGGMRIKASDQAKVDIGGIYKCVFAPHPGVAPLVLDATLCHHETMDDGRAFLGFHFLGYEMTTEGRQLLARVAEAVSSYHNADIRTRRRVTTTGASSR